MGSLFREYFQRLMWKLKKVELAMGTLADNNWDEINEITTLKSIVSLDYSYM